MFKFKELEGLTMVKIRVKRKKKKSRKLLGRRYHGAGQASGGARKSGQRGGFGAAGIKDHMKFAEKFKDRIAQIGSYGFTRHALIRPTYVINVGEIVTLIKENRIPFEKDEKGNYIVKFTNPNVKILGGGKVDIPLVLIVHEQAHVTEKAKQKIEKAGGKIVAGIAS